MLWLNYYLNFKSISQDINRYGCEIMIRRQKEDLKHGRK